MLLTHRANEIYFFQLKLDKALEGTVEDIDLNKSCILCRKLSRDY